MGTLAAPSRCSEVLRSTEVRALIHWAPEVPSDTDLPRLFASTDFVWPRVTASSTLAPAYAANGLPAHWHVVL